MRAQQRRGEVAARWVQQHRAQRLRLAGAGDEHEQLAGGEQRAQADRERVGRDVLEAAELLGSVGPRLRVQRDDARALVKPRARLVEGDVPVVAEAENGEVDPAPRRVVAGGARTRRPGRAPRRRARGMRRSSMPAQLAPQVGAEAALVSRAEAAVLVELEHRGVRARQLAAGRVGAQRGVDAERRAPGGQEHAQPRTRAQAVCDQLGRGPRDRRPLRRAPAVRRSRPELLAQLQPHRLDGAPRPAG